MGATTYHGLSAIAVGDGVVGHVVSHAPFGVAALCLALWLFNVARRGRGSGLRRFGLRTALGGLVLFALGAFVESLGAFGYDGNAHVNGLANAHDAGLLITSFALLGIVLGALLMIVSSLVGVAHRAR